MNTRTLLAAVLLAGGCAGADSYVYTKPGATTEQKERDKDLAELDKKKGS